ncbi:MAG: hypothetical protein JW937_04665 [Candidatus Omnitrophica bacterium]|nr:hypothetical protein [Candidatus Omnitrophota bacterium]
MKRPDLGLLLILILLAGAIFGLYLNRPHVAVEAYAIPKEESAMPPVQAAAGIFPPSARPRWETPDRWQELPASGMRLASFRIAGTGGAEADVSVIVLAGEAGGLLANVNRWRGQIGLDPVDESGLRDQIQAFEFRGHSATLVEVVSEAAPAVDRQKQAIFVAIVPHQGQQYFFKLSGEAELVLSEKESLKAFLQSFGFE